MAEARREKKLELVFGLGGGVAAEGLCKRGINIYQVRASKAHFRGRHASVALFQCNRSLAYCN